MDTIVQTEGSDETAAAVAVATADDIDDDEDEDEDEEVEAEVKDEADDAVGAAVRQDSNKASSSSEDAD